MLGTACVVILGTAGVVMLGTGLSCFARDGRELLC